MEGQCACSQMNGLLSPVSYVYWKNKLTTKRDKWKGLWDEQAHTRYLVCVCVGGGVSRNKEAYTFTHNPSCVHSSTHLTIPFLSSFLYLIWFCWNLFRCYIKRFRNWKCLRAIVNWHPFTQFFFLTQECSFGSAVLRPRPSNGSGACSRSHSWAYCVWDFNWQDLHFVEHKVGLEDMLVY